MSNTEASVRIAARGKRIAGLPDSVNVGLTQPVSVLRAHLAKATKLSQARLRLTTGDGSVLPDTLSLAESGFAPESTVWVKDLGPQIGWRTVFVIEYAGPLIVHPLVYAWPGLQTLLYGRAIQHSPMQR